MDTYRYLQWLIWLCLRLVEDPLHVSAKDRPRTATAQALDKTFGTKPMAVLVVRYR